MNADPVVASPLRIAAVGLEHDEIYRVLDRLRRHEAAELVAISERSGRLRMAAEGRYRVPVFPRLSPLLEDTAVDAVLVATANGSKAATIEESLRAGKHVIAHAPLAVTVAQFYAVAQAQTASGMALVSLHPLRFTPAYVRLRELIAAGLLGAISQIVTVNSQKVAATPRPQAFYYSPTHGGILTSLAVHDIDMLQWLGGELTVIGASTECHGITGHADFEDAGILRCSLAGGGEAMVVCNWLAPEAGDSFQEMTVIGTNGTAWVTGGKLQAFAGRPGTSLQGEPPSDGFVATQDEPGQALLLESDKPAEFDVDSAMLDAALRTLANGDLRSVATVDALRTSQAAVDAQTLARQDGA